MYKRIFDPATVKGKFNPAFFISFAKYFPLLCKSLLQSPKYILLTMQMVLTGTAQLSFSYVTASVDCANRSCNVAQPSVKSSTGICQLYNCLCCQCSAAIC